MKELIARMEALNDSGDQEVNHIEADAILCEAIRSLGSEGDELVEAFKELTKWYS